MIVDSSFTSHNNILIISRNKQKQTNKQTKKPYFKDSILNVYKNGARKNHKGIRIKELGKEGEKEKEKGKEGKQSYLTFGDIIYITGAFSVLESTSNR